MAKGMSLHIGVNGVDPAHYGSDEALAFCEADAQSMLEIATQQGFDPATLLLSADATCETVSDGIKKAARDLVKCDIFFLSYAGHGGQVRDVNKDERRGEDGRFVKGDNLDETWCLFDRQQIDDELAMLWGEFQPGVRILVLSDSCHSGTATRGHRDHSLTTDENIAKFGQPNPVHRALTRKRCNEIYMREHDLYDSIQIDIPKILPRSDACILLLSGCQDKQLSGEDMGHGLFTQGVIEAWDGGSFSGDYSQLRTEILLQMPDDQSPNMEVIGTKNKAFIREKPFTI